MTSLPKSNFKMFTFKFSLSVPLLLQTTIVRFEWQRGGKVFGKVEVSRCKVK
jgi:hypothetical protein